MAVGMDEAASVAHREDTKEGTAAASTQEACARSCGEGSPCTPGRACWEEQGCKSLAASARGPLAAAHGASRASGGSS